MFFFSRSFNFSKMLVMLEIIEIKMLYFGKPFKDITNGGLICLGIRTNTIRLMRELSWKPRFLRSLQCSYKRPWSLKIFKQRTVVLGNLYMQDQGL